MDRSRGRSQRGGIHSEDVSQEVVFVKDFNRNRTAIEVMPRIGHAMARLSLPIFVER